MKKIEQTLYGDADVNVSCVCWWKPNKARLHHLFSSWDLELSGLEAETFIL